MYPSDESQGYYDAVLLGPWDATFHSALKKRANNNYQEWRKCPERANEYSTVIYRRVQSMAMESTPSDESQGYYDAVLLGLWDATFHSALKKRANNNYQEEHRP